MNAVLATYVLLAQTIAPFIDAQTVAVGHLDLTRVDVAAAEARFASLAGIAPGQADPMAENWDAAAAWLAEARRAGIKELFVVVSLADMPREPVRLVVPLKKGADAQDIKKIRALLFSGRADGPVEATPLDRPGWRPKRMTAVAHNAVVFASAEFIERLPAMTPHPRPHLAEAFAAAGDSTAQLLLLPTADHRRVAEEMMPVMPDQFGGGPGSTWTRGVQWAAIGIDGPPKPQLGATIQSADAAAAKALHEAIQRAYAALGTFRPVQDVLPDFDKTAPALTPTVEGDRLTLKLAPPAADALLDQCVGSILHQARRNTLALDRLKHIGVSLHMYRSSHKQNWPPDLDVLVAEKFAAERWLNSPVTGRRYVYIRPPRNAKDTTIVAFTDPADGNLTTVDVLFADGHVQLLAVDKYLLESIKKARALSEKAYGPPTQPATPAGER